ncbi:hypothetical protein [Methanobacterium spitsbergense]|uniref:Uncharacterized protein n=1 Tax=Methanobacterium spitsbergense TaxID=2874285 RepID=A0A8T5V0H7_9EURY|nr:hypothetical protein [Methanobacterium spitsbergense]MBZ2166523.1 hypothetical protein [Methanobacterium spitsbergense]
MKKILPIIVIGLILNIIAISGCTDNNIKTHEVLLKTINISSSNNTEFSLNPIIVDIPDNATSVRYDYKLIGDAYGSICYVGTNANKIDPTSGETPISINYHYLQASAGQTINGTYNSTDHGVFYYTGNFKSGTIKLYANIPA